MECVFDHGSKCVALTEKCCVGCCFRKTKKRSRSRAEESEKANQFSARSATNLHKRKILRKGKVMGANMTWEKLCRKAGLSPKQKVLVSEYIDSQIKEAQAETEMAFSLALIESEHFGTRLGSTRLQRVKERAKQILSEEVAADAETEI